MIEVTSASRQAIIEHAKAEMPSECCGLLLLVDGEQEYFPCRNMMKDLPGQATGQFVMNPEDRVTGEDRGTVLALVHSHPNALPLPSQPDRVGCRMSGVPWLIIGYPTLAEAWLLPDSDTEEPYLEREFAHGVLDCYTLAEDYYRREFGIILPSREGYEWDADWWNNGKEIYSKKNIMAAGFVEVSDAPREHDLHFIQIRSPVPNHIAIQLDNGHIMHHLQDRLSCKTVYGGMWAKHTAYTMRHQRFA